MKKETEERKLKELEQLYSNACKVAGAYRSLYETYEKLGFAGKLALDDIMEARNESEAANRLMAKAFFALMKQRKAMGLRTWK